MPALTGLRRERALASPQFADGAFRNRNGATPSMKNGFSVIPEMIFGRGARVPRAALPVADPLEVWAKAPTSPLRVTWLGHSTLLLECDGVRILTDPVFGERASPFSFAGPQRFHRVPATLEQLPVLDAVLLSHDHYDHLCAETMRSIAALRVPVITSLGVGAHLEALGFDPTTIVELDWWEEHVLPGGRASFTATPAQHFSGRGFGDRNRTLWSSWVVRTDRTRLFFSGDTGLTEDFATIGERLGPFDLTLLEIGAFHPSWSAIHLGPENALRAFRLLGGGALLPVHWGTFDLALHAWDEPAERLFTLAEREGARLVTPALGAPVEPSLVDGPTPWWRAVAGRAAERASPSLLVAE